MNNNRRLRMSLVRNNALTAVVTRITGRPISLP